MLNDNGDRTIAIVFHHGQLHQVSYEFPIDQYDSILKQPLTRKFGLSRIVRDPHDSSYVVSKDWGSVMDGVSLIRRWDNRAAILEIIFNN
jgi:hypothetical protein